MTEKRKYEKPSTRVIELKQQAQLLAGSNGQAGVQNYEWNDVDPVAPIMNLDDFPFNQ